MNYRRARVGGGTYFFTVNLAQREGRLLVDHIDILRNAARYVKTTEHLSHFIGEFGLLIPRRGRHMIPPWWCPEIGDNRHRAKLPENQSYILLSGQDGKLMVGHLRRELRISMADSLISRPGEEFLLDLQAQLERADQSLAVIADEFNKTSPGSDLSRAGRIETKEFISTIKYVLDQLTVRVWTTLVAPELPPETAAKRTEVIYYPYASDEQMFRSALGKMVNIKDFDTDTQTPGEEMFAAWLRATQPIHPTPYGALYTIGRLSRLPHRKLIDQRKSRLFLVEAFGLEGGGASMRFKNKPGRFTLYGRTEISMEPRPESAATQSLTIQKPN